MPRNRGRSKRKLSTLSRERPTEDEFEKFWEGWEPDNSIAAAITGACMVEYELEILLRAHFKKSDDTTWGLLTSQEGPLSGLSQKILMADAFRVCSDETINNLDIIRQIRNAFAHSMKLVSFQHELIVKALHSAKAPPKATKKHKEIIEFVRTTSAAREAFVTLCLFTSNQLHFRRMDRDKRRHRKKIRRYKSLINNLYEAPQPALQLGRLGLYPPHQIADPKATILEGLLPDPQPKAPAKPRSKGK